MDKKHWYTIIICSMIIVISGFLYNYYYRTYVAPKSYTIGEIKPKDYTSLDIKEYISNENVLFSQDLDDITFTINDDGTAVYEFIAEAVDFNGEENDYLIYANNYILNDVEESAGAISGTYTLNYYDIDKSIIKTSILKLSFASYTKSLTFKLTLNADDVGLLMRYFELNDFIVTLSKNPYSLTNDIVIIQPASEYQVNFVDGDEIINTQMVEFGNYAILPDYELNNCAWSIDGFNVVDVSTCQILGDTTFILIEPFTLTLDSNGGNCDVTSKLLYCGDTYGELPTPVREGYIFNGWYTDAIEGIKVASTTTMGKSNLTIYAQWIPINYTIVFDGNGATDGTMNSITCIYDVEQALSTNAYTKDDATFVGWSTSIDGEVEYLDGATILNLTSNTEVITLYAIWTNSYYTAQIYTMTTSGSYPSGYTLLTINSLSGNVDLTNDASTTTYVVEGGIELDKITDIDGNVITSVDVSEDNSTIVKFYYKRIQHTLIPDANGGTITDASGYTIAEDNLSASKILYYQQAFNTLPTPVREGYTFIGWFTASAGGTQVTATTTMDVEDITIYAQWEAI